MRIKPILFSTDMVRAILDGRKTVTRRVLRGEAQQVASDYVRRYSEDLDTSELIVHWWVDTALERYALYRPGDVLWVRETFRVDYLSNIVGSGRVHYKADGSFGDLHFQPARYDMMRRAQLKPGWRPNEHMPKEAARIWLRVERLQKMTAAEAHREGVDSSFSRVSGDEAVGNYVDFSLEKFEPIWDSTIKPEDRKLYGWAANPWVWVTAFERCEPPEEV